MLQGTFETLALPEVLGLLASARKSGALRIEAGPVSAVVRLEDGHCCAVETGEQPGPVASGSLLLARLVDVCFSVTRQESGGFRFAGDEPAPWSCDEPVELSDALVEVDRLLKQWREILHVIPSLDCRPRLLDALELDEIVVDRDRWALLVGIDGRRTVRELVQRAARPVIDVCQALVELVEAGAIGVIDPAAAVAPTPVPAPAPAPAPVPAPVVPPPVVPTTVVPTPVANAATNGSAEPREAPPERPVEAPAVAPPAAAEGERGGERSDDDGGEAPDKGAFLRLFSGLRDS